MVGALLWLSLVSFFLYRLISRYGRLTAGTNKATLGEVIEKVLKEQGLASKKIEGLDKRADKIEEDGQAHIQKIGLVRFNPFSETGGDQSFTLAVLDGQKSGVVISSLHGRESTRLYAKAVKSGKVEGYKLSREENEAIEKASK